MDWCEEKPTLLWATHFLLSLLYLRILLIPPCSVYSTVEYSRVLESSYSLIFDFVSCHCIQYRILKQTFHTIMFSYISSKSHEIV